MGKFGREACNVQRCAVKGRDEPVTIEVVVTRHGPIVEGDPRQPAAEKFELSPARPIAGIGVAGTTAAESRVALAACLTGTDERGNKWMDTVLDVLLAKDADGIEAAVNEWTEPVNNVSRHADTNSNKTTRCHV